MNRLNKYDLVYVGLTDEAFWLSTAKAGVLTNKGWEGSFIFSVEADEDRKGRVLKKKKIQNVSFCFFLIYFLYEIFTVSILCSSFDYWTLAAYTYFSIWLNFLPVYCAYTQACGSDFGFGCISYCRHCHSTGHVKDMWLLHYQCETLKDAAPISKEPQNLRRKLASSLPTLLLWYTVPVGFQAITAVRGVCLLPAMFR